MAAIIETKENEKDGLLKTHYYKTSYDEMKDVYLHFWKIRVTGLFPLKTDTMKFLPRFRI